MALLASLKTNLIAAGVFLLTLLGGLLKYFMAKAKREEEKADRFKAALDRQSDIQEMDTELDKDFQSHKAAIKKEINDGEEITSLSKPNDF